MVQNLRVGDPQRNPILALFGSDAGQQRRRDQPLRRAGAPDSTDRAACFRNVVGGGIEPGPGYRILCLLAKPVYPVHPDDQFRQSYPGAAVRAGLEVYEVSGDRLTPGRRAGPDRRQASGGTGASARLLFRAFAVGLV